MKTAILFLFVQTLTFSLSAQEKPERLFVPAGGNAWISGGGKAVFSNDGLTDWSDPITVCTMYVRVQTGQLTVSLNVISSAASRVRVTMNNESKEVDIASGVSEHVVGTWPIASAGYQAVAVQGVSKTGDKFGSLSGITISGSAVGGDLSFVKNNEGNYFYWGRRGPSVHLRYDLKGKTDIAWFYSEITVPEGNDVMGSYYMANGFADGYFGFQVNTATERRVLFSVWSPFKTDNPKEIPEGDKILLLKKGDGVYTGEFGNEGSGGQSYLRYPWKAGTSYGFLLRAQPQGTEATIYTAWFFAPEVNRWTLIASWRRPKKATHLTSLYSFLENFIPETGNASRLAEFGNQWVRDAAGNWIELTEAKFTGDNTARKNYRKDYGGGVNGQSFFLRNCGFFSDFTQLDQSLKRTSKGVVPKIDFTMLP